MIAETKPSMATLPTPAAPSDDLGIDREFLVKMAQIPLIALVWVGICALSHQLWQAVSPTSTNFAPLVVLCFGMVLAAIIDGWAFKVPNWLTLSLVISGWMIGGLNDAGVSISAAQGGVGAALACTAIGFAMLFPLLVIVGMGQGDVKMLMGFGSWIGFFFGFKEGAVILVWAFALGAIIGGLCGIVMMALRRKFKKNLSNFKEIAIDLKVLATMGPSAAASRSSARRPGWDRLPYGIPLCVGFLCYLAYRYIDGTLPMMGQ